MSKRSKLIIPTPEENRAITRAARLDPDNPPLTKAELGKMRPVRGRPRAAVTKETTTLRLDPEVLNGFRATGRGWQTRMNTVLKAWLKRNRAA